MRPVTDTLISLNCFLKKMPILASKPNKARLFWTAHALENTQTLLNLLFDLALTIYDQPIENSHFYC